MPRSHCTGIDRKNKRQPELVTKQLKEIIKDNHKHTEEEILNYLGLPQRCKLIDNYVAKFQERIQKINKEQQYLAKNNSGPEA